MVCGCCPSGRGCRRRPAGLLLAHRCRASCYARGQGVVCATTAVSGVRFIDVFCPRVLSSSCVGMAYSLVAGSLPSHLEVVGFDVKDCRDLG